MSKLNGVVEVEDLQEATREENFQVVQRMCFKGMLVLVPGHKAKIVSASAKPGDEFGGNVFLRGNTLIVSD